MDAERLEVNVSISEDYYEAKEVDRKLSYFLATPSSIICDIGGASGVDTFPLAMLGSFCVSVDTDGNAVRLGKLRSKRKQTLREKVEFVIASATHLPFRHCSFDLTTCFSVLDHIPAKDHVCLAVQEMSRVIKDFGHVVITFPNKLFMIGTMSMKMKRILDNNAIFERRFTPREMGKIIIQSKLIPIFFHSKYPTKIGAALLEYNLPKIVGKIPKSLLRPLFTVIESLFRKTENIRCLRVFGARFGYLSRKIPDACS